MRSRIALCAALVAVLASWGFVVVAAHNPNTGSGDPVLDSVRWMTAQNGREGSAFQGKLDPARVGAIGHSQGASGVVNALIKSRGQISTAIPIEIPAQVFCSNPTSCTDTRKLQRGSLFLVNGSSDALISPSSQLAPWQLAGLQSNSAYYEAAPDHIDKVGVTLNGGDHNDVQGQPDCGGASKPCGRGVDGFLGYPTAWMMDRLRGDADARRAFVEKSGELFDDSPNWSNQHSNIGDQDSD